MRLSLAMGVPEDKLVLRDIRALMHILGYVLLLSGTEHCCHGYINTISNDTNILLSFKANADRGGALSSWNTSNCCSGNGSSSGWLGVACQGSRVSRLALRGLRLVGPIGALVSLTELRVLVLSDNLLDGSLPNLTNWKALWLLNLAQNQLSGPIPPSISSLSRLWRLDLSHNSLSGSIPASLNSLTRLLTLHLQSNEFTGSIPLLNIPSLTDLSLQNNQISGLIPLLQLGNLTTFDASYNNLTGPIPASLSKFPASSFTGNVNLCGGPLTACNESQNILSNPASPMVVPSNPSSGPGGSTPALSSSTKKSSSRLSLGAIIAIVIGDVILLLVLTLLFLLYYWKKMVYESEDEDEKWQGKKGGDGEMEKGYANSMIGGAQGPDGEKSKLVFVSGEKRFGLDDLLKASAEMLGKGSFGTAYKAVLEDGCAVVVKRLKEVSTTGKREFEHNMELIGQLSHPNIVPLRAYYYAKQEKLLVYDFMAGGSLYNLLHGNRGPGRVPLDWATRLDIALGTAKGLAHIHGNGPQQQQEQGQEEEEEKEGKGRGMMSHGNLKSSNVLLDARGNALVADCGLADLVNPSVIATRLVGYRAPESHAKGATSSAAPPFSPATWQRAQRCDVYSFGVVLLELLTGRAPSQCLQDDGLDLATWVQSVVREEWTAEVFDLELMRSHKHDREEEEMVGLLQVAMACTSRDPAHRPAMPHVVRIIEDVRAPSDRSPAAAAAAAAHAAHDEGTSLSQSPSMTSEEAGTTTPSTIT